MPSTLHDWISLWQQLLATLPEHHFTYLLDRHGRCLALQIPDESRLSMPASEIVGKSLDEFLRGSFAGFEFMIVERRFWIEWAIANQTSILRRYPHPLDPSVEMTVKITPLIQNGRCEEVLMSVYDTVSGEVPARRIVREVISCQLES